MVQADLSDCLSDPRNRPLSADQLKRLKFTPHRATYDDAHGRLLVYLRKGMGEDYSTNTDMVESACQLQSARKVVQVYLVQRDGDKIMGWQTAMNVREKILGMPTRQGEFGPYVWLAERTFDVVGNPAFWRDEELPF